ncbi:MAG: EF-hand domain-containing protein [Pseudomonadota bacterium]
MKMKPVYPLLLAAAALSLPSTAVLAQPRGPDAMFEKMDLNGDGALSREELNEFGAARFSKIDTDGDGNLTEQEIQANVQSRAAERAQKRFAKADADGDGVIRRAEFEQQRETRQARLFSRFDTDGDGLLSREELREAWLRRRDRN